MIYKEKFVSDEIISKLPNWLIHFLWYLLEECISCQVNGKPREIIMPCPHAVDCKVEIREVTDRLVMQIAR